MCKLNTESHSSTTTQLDVFNQKKASLHCIKGNQWKKKTHKQHRQKSPGLVLQGVESTHTLLARGNPRMHSKRKKRYLRRQRSPDTKPQSRPQLSARSSTRHKTGAWARSSRCDRRARCEPSAFFSPAPVRLDLWRLERRRVTNCMIRE